MVAYFKGQNNLFMAAGAAVLVLLMMPFYKIWLPKQEFYVRAFFLALPAFAGVIAGRLGASWWANRQLRSLDELLYQQADPKSFIRAFTPLVERVPKETVEYVNGRVKLSYAYEAMGEFDTSLEMVKDLKPEELRLHALAASSLVTNEKLRVYLLMEDTEGAHREIENLKTLLDAARGRVPALICGLENCIRLGKVWLEFLRGESCEETYIKEEGELAKNEIHRSEMELLLARMKLKQNEKETAENLLRELNEKAKELYAGREAARILKENF